MTTDTAAEYKWLSEEIRNKWPAARAYGPRVDIDNALEFIRRTDRTFVSSFLHGNAKRFHAQYMDMVGLNEDDYNAWSAFSAAFGHIPLEHFGSDWLHCCYVGGPNGPVSPTGEVFISKNFGKWPSVREVEGDLIAITENFPWLSLDLALWDSLDESEAVNRGDSLTMAWRVESGTWRRMSVDQFKVLDTHKQDNWAHHLSAIMSGRPSELTECYFTIGRIEQLWGDQIRKAAKKAVEGIAT